MKRDGKPSSARALADVTTGSVVATVDIAAPAARVFRAMSDPRELVQWWGSAETYRAHRWDADFRVGGTWRVEGRSASGEPYCVHGEFLEIVAPRKIVQTWSYDWDGDQPATKLTYLLEDIPGGTRVIVRHEGFATPQACGSHASGWELVLQWLEDHIESAMTPGP